MGPRFRGEAVQGLDGVAKPTVQARQADPIAPPSGDLDSLGFGAADSSPAQRIEVVIRSDGAGERLDRALQRQLPELSRTRLKQLILDGAVRVGGEPVRDPSRR